LQIENWPLKIANRLIQAVPLYDTSLLAPIFNLQWSIFNLQCPYPKKTPVPASGVGQQLPVVPRFKVAAAAGRRQGGVVQKRTVAGAKRLRT